MIDGGASEQRALHLLVASKDGGCSVVTYLVPSAVTTGDGFCERCNGLTGYGQACITGAEVFLSPHRRVGGATETKPPHRGQAIATITASTAGIRGPQLCALESVVRRGQALFEGITTKEASSAIVEGQSGKTVGESGLQRTRTEPTAPLWRRRLEDCHLSDDEEGLGPISRQLYG